MFSTDTYTVQDRTPYTYFIRWTELDLNYYGRRTAKDCRPEEFFVKYFTSSKLVWDVIAEHGMPDVIKIHKIFVDVDSCKIQEERFLKRVNAARSLRWLNQTNGDKKFDTTGKPLSKSHKQKISQKGTGKKHSTETKLKQSRAAIGHQRCLGKKHSTETKLKQSRAAMGNKSRTDLPHSLETKLKMSISAKNKPKILCPYCEKYFDPGNFGKYHGSKCKYYQINLLSIHALL
jgi:hypothetical protein